MYISIPVKGSKLVLGSIDWIAHSADRVLILAEDVEFEPGELPGNVEVSYAATNLQEARRIGVDWAEANGQPYIFQIDDDIRLKPDQQDGGFVALASYLDRYPFLGAVCATPKLLGYYDKDRESNMDFKFVPSPTQMWGLRIAAYRETPGFTVPTMEDIFVGLSMWKNGYGVATLPDLEHDHIRGRLTEDRVGGQPPSVRDELMPACLEILQNEFVGNVLKSASLGKTKKGFYKFMPRYAWMEMGRRVRERFGPVGYTDHRIHV